MGRPRKNPLPENEVDSMTIIQENSSTNLDNVEPQINERRDRFAQLEELLSLQGEQIATLTAALSQSKVNKPKRVIEHTANVMFIEDRAVVGWENAKTVNGELFLPVILRDIEGKEEKELVPYTNTLNEQRRYPCEIINQKAEEHDLHQGVIPMEFQTVDLDPAKALGGRRGDFQSRKIILEQKIVTYKARVKFLDGPWKDREVEIDTKCLNP